VLHLGGTDRACESGAKFNDEGNAMKKLSMVAVAILVAMSVSACGTVGKGKGKAPAAPIVTKG